MIRGCVKRVLNRFLAKKKSNDKTTFQVRRLADLILEEKRAKEAKEKHINEEISIRKKEEQNAKVLNKLVMISE